MNNRREKKIGNFIYHGSRLRGMSHFLCLPFCVTLLCPPFGIATTDKRLDRFCWNLLGINFRVYSRWFFKRKYRKTCNLRFSCISCYRLEINAENRQNIVEIDTTHGLLTIYAKKNPPGGALGPKQDHFFAKFLHFGGFYVQSYNKWTVGGSAFSF